MFNDGFCALNNLSCHHAVLVKYLAVSSIGFDIILGVFMFTSGIFNLPTVLTALSNALLGIPITFSLKFLAIFTGLRFCFKNSLGFFTILLFHFRPHNNHTAAHASSDLNSSLLSGGNDSIHSVNQGVFAISPHNQVIVSETAFCHSGGNVSIPAPISNDAGIANIDASDCVAPAPISNTSSHIPVCLVWYCSIGHHCTNDCVPAIPLSNNQAPHSIACPTHFTVLPANHISDCVIGLSDCAGFILSIALLIGL
jgi:hypothetical protein